MPSPPGLRSFRPPAPSRQALRAGTPTASLATACAWPTSWPAILWPCGWPICHDLGKINTDPTLLPHHYGHEQRGVPLALQLAQRLRLPGVYAKAGALAAAEHMKAGIFHSLRTGTRRDLLWRVHRAGLEEPFWKLADADSGADIRRTAQAQLQALLPVTLPPHWRNRGADSAAVCVNSTVRPWLLCAMERSKVFVGGRELL